MRGATPLLLTTRFDKSSWNYAPGIFHSDRLPQFITMEIKLHLKLHWNSVPWKNSLSKASQRAIHFEYILFELHSNYTKPYFVSMAKLPQTNTLHLKFLFTKHHPISYLQNRTINEASEPFKANESCSADKCWVFTLLINQRAGKIEQQTEMLHQKAVDLHCHYSLSSSSSPLNIKGYSLANEQD